MGKHLVDLDEDRLAAARAALGTRTIKDTVNQALKAATADRDHQVITALDRLAAAELHERNDAWQ